MTAEDDQVWRALRWLVAVAVGLCVGFWAWTGVAGAHMVERPTIASAKALRCHRYRHHRRCHRHHAKPQPIVTASQSPLTVALVARSTWVLENGPDLQSAAAALEYQIDSQVEPLWGTIPIANIDFTPEPLPSVRVIVATEPPAGAWTLEIVEQFGPESECHGLQVGCHWGFDGTPGAAVEAWGKWTLIASHELIEMLIDPHDNEQALMASGPVAYEPCDPVEMQSYLVNGIEVSDFVLPAYFAEAAGQQDYLSSLPGR